MPYTAPLESYRLLLSLTGFDGVAQTDQFAEATPDTVTAVLSEAGKLCEEVLAPLSTNGDKTPAYLENGVVRTSPGFAEGYRAIAEGGWVAAAADPEHGGLGLPMSLTSCVNEMIGSACLALQLNPLMSQGQIEALEHHASDALKELYLPRLISGEWTGTMNLTEPQAGSDVGALTTKAEDNGDGTFAITGQKVYITWGDHDFGGNICHLVLARLPDAPAGSRGISLFLVPKYIPDDAGEPGQPNSLRVVSLEHKLGLHGSPTCVMSYEGATGWIVGAPNKGLAAMFTMMNNARLGVGLQGVAVAERAYQHALAYAHDRVQGKSETGTIFGHADVRRMLAEMKAETFAARAIGLACAVAIDMGNATKDPVWQARAALLTPMAKAFGTETGMAVSNIGIQVHGGMGYVEETGAAQFLRDVRVTAIYEGTNGIQALDLVGRKLMDGGEAANTLLFEIQTGAEAARASLPDLAGPVWNAAETLREALELLLEQDVADRQPAAVAFLMAFSRLLGGHYHLAAALARPGGAEQRLARFYIERLLPQYRAWVAQVRATPDTVTDLSAEDLRP